MELIALQAGFSSRKKDESHYDPGRVLGEQRLEADCVTFGIEKAAPAGKVLHFPRLGATSYGSSECSRSHYGLNWQHWQCSDCGGDMAYWISGITRMHRPFSSILVARGGQNIE